MLYNGVAWTIQSSASISSSTSEMSGWICWMFAVCQECCSSVAYCCCTLAWCLQFRSSCGIIVMNATSFPRSSLTSSWISSSWWDSFDVLLVAFLTVAEPGFRWLFHPFPPWRLTFCRQFEVLVQFCMGTIDSSDRYCDEHRVVAYKYCTSATGFLFDFVTSLPWSFNDLYSYQVALLSASSCPGSVFLVGCDITLGNMLRVLLP